MDDGRLQADLVIVGFGPAAHRLLQELAKYEIDHGRIVVLGEEPHAAYNRILLSPLLAGELNQAALDLEVPAVLQPHLHILTDHRVAVIDTDLNTVICANGCEVRFKRLVMATGARPAFPALEGVTAQGVIGFRNFRDVQKMQAAAKRGGNAVVVGGGLLGLEAAEGLRKSGMQVTVLHRSDCLLNRQLDRVAAETLRCSLEARGCHIVTSANIDHLLTVRDTITGVALQDGNVISCDLLVFATGIVPNKELAVDSGLAVDRAICVNDRMQTSSQNIFALGECSQFEHHTYGLVAPIWRQAKVLANVLCGGTSQYEELAVATQLKVSGIELFSCGELQRRAPDLRYLDRENGDYRAIWLQDGRIIAAVMYGDVTLGQWYFEQLLAETEISDLGDAILFPNLLTQRGQRAA